jgi:hypothetical protein
MVSEMSSDTGPEFTSSVQPGKGLPSTHECEAERANEELEIPFTPAILQTVPLCHVAISYHPLCLLLNGVGWPNLTKTAQGTDIALSLMSEYHGLFWVIQDRNRPMNKTLRGGLRWGLCGGGIVLAVWVGASALLGQRLANAQAPAGAVASTSGQTNPGTAVEGPIKPQAAETPVPAPTPAAQAAKPASHAVAQAAVKMGVLSCVSRINQVATYLTANAQSGVFIFTPKNPPDQHLFSTSFEILGQDKSLVYASANFYPNQDAVYDTVQYVERSPEEVAKTAFANLKRVGMVKKNIILLDGGAVKVFLMPAGSGCVVIKKEVVQ